MRFLPLLFFLFQACTNPPYRGSDVCGADDFVIDSYQIREGKFCVLEMEGKCYDCLDQELLLEYKDLIHDNDILYIVIHHPTRCDIAQAVAVIGANQGYRVMEGKIYLPDLEPIHVQGLSLLEAKEKIEKIYRKQIDDLEVFITYRDRIQRKVELMGLVSVPTIPVDGRIRLFEVLSIAKVPPEAGH